MRLRTLALAAYAAASGVCVLALAQQAPAAADAKTVTTAVYSVQAGNKVDARTLSGWKTWRAFACDRCHGQEQEGLVGPALVNSLKVLTEEQFHTTVINGRLEKGMPSFGSSPMMQSNWEGLYAYLKGRSDGNIAPGHLYPLDGTGSPQP